MRPSLFHSLIALVFAAACASLARAQSPLGALPAASSVPVSAAQAAGSAGGQAAQAGGGGSTIANPMTSPGSFQLLNANSLESGTLLKIISQAFDTNSDSINPENGTMNWKGHSYDIGKFQVFRSRFERYLSLPPSNNQKAYADTIGKITDLLSTRNGSDGALNMVAAWKLLYQASDFDADGGASLAVANQVFNAWRIRDERQALDVEQTELERLRSQQQGDVVYGGDALAAETGKSTSDAASNAALAAGSAIPSNIGGTNIQTGGTATTTTNTGKGGSSSSNSNTSNAGIGVMVGPTGQFFRATQLAETEAKIKAISAAGLLSVTEAKLQFQSQILNLFLQRRFQQALIASSFYRFIFKGSQQNLVVGKKELASFLPSSDMAFGIESIEFLSREAIDDVNSGMLAVAASYAANNKVAAIEQMQETFFLGEYLPAVTQFDYAKKQVLLTLYEKMDTARKLADLRDYDAVITLNNEINGMTGDFQGDEVNGAVRSAQRMSSLALSAAKQAAAAGDFDKAQEFVQKAALIWPLNPAIKAYTDSMAQQSNIETQAAIFFDDAFKRGDYRRIYEKRAELAVAFLDDSLRGPQLKGVIDRMARVEIFLAQADELLAQNNAFAAWEALVGAAALAPDDVQVNQRMATLAPRVADFVGRLDQAQRYEKSERYAVSLTDYLAAQDLYPASQIARTGIERMSAAMLDSIASDAADKSAPQK